MAEIKKCLNEWNAVVEALGKGKQIILIRKYGSSLDKFLLYPTINYAKKENYLDSFKENSRQFVENNTFPKIKDNKTEIKYLAQIEKVIKTSPKRIGSFNKYSIWTNKHVKSYLGNNNAYIWILRIFKLDKPQMSIKNPGIMYANLKEEVSLDGMKPVLSDEEFEEAVGSLR